MTVDPVTLEVVRNATAAVAEEMNATLVRTSYSPNIKDRKDCSCAVFDADGELVSQAENIPVHLGAMPFSVASALDKFPPDSLEPGDEILLNDPFHGGAHLPDLTLVTPAVVDGELIGLLANRAHHADIGGATAGSVAADSTEIYQEGLRLPPVKLSAGGAVNGAVVDLLLANVRTPTERRGDLRAQQAANRTGVDRLAELHDRYDALPTILDEVQDYAERRMRAEIGELPDGAYRFADALDDDGQGAEDLPIDVTVTVDGESITVDFDGTAAQVRGAINAPFAVTASATYYAIRCVTDPEIPPNAGAYRPIEITAPEGTIVNAQPPAAVVGGNLEVSQRVTDALLGAMGSVVPERAAAAGQGTMNNLTFGGRDPRTEGPYTFYETLGGGFGGRAGADGMDGVHVHMSNTLNTPAEVLETAYPLRVTDYSFRSGSGGAGEYRGGLGLRRDIEALAETTFSLLADRRTHRPYGLNGGEPGASGADYLITDGAPEPIPAKSTHRLQPGDVVSIRTPGGGGYGDPEDRNPESIRRDLAAGKLSPDSARSDYDFDPSGT